MISDPAPFTANLFSYFYENKWLQNLKREDLISATKFANRFIDDIRAFNDDGLFEKHHHEIKKRTR